MSAHITVVLDRTGSMSVIKNEIIGGYNSFLSEQRKVPDTRITLIQFDSQDAHEVVYRNVAVADAGELNESNYIPRALTPLFDAVGYAINETTPIIENSDIDKVIFVIITDGQENASREWTAEKVRELIDTRKRDGWEFVFLGADLDSFAQAHAIGIPMANAMAYDADRDGTQSAFRDMSHNTMAYAGGQSVSMAWSGEQRSAQKAEKKRKKAKA